MIFRAVVARRMECWSTRGLEQGCQVEQTGNKCLRSGTTIRSRKDYFLLCLP